MRIPFTNRYVWIEWRRGPLYDPGLCVGMQPAPLNALDITGQPISLEQFGGHVVLLHYWASWCGKCRTDMPQIVAVYRAYHSAGFDVIGISLDSSDTHPCMQDAIEQFGMTWPEIRAGEDETEHPLVAVYKVRAVPFSLLIGRDGAVAAVNPEASRLEAAVEQALAQSSPDPAEPERKGR